jgi:cystathionine beta-synthase
MVLADPKGSILADYIHTGDFGEAGSWLVEGIGEDFIPPVSDLSRVRKAYTIPDSESFAAARALLKSEGVLAGSSSGTLIAAALRYCREQTEPKRVVTLVCDTGAKYLSKVFDDAWIAEQGLGKRTSHGDLRDLVVRSHREGGTITVSPEDTLLTAYKRMRGADVSQLPVVLDNRLVGLIDESDVLAAVGTKAQAREKRFLSPVRDAMVTDLHTVDAHQPFASVLPLFDRGEVALIVDGADFLGLVTPVDFINHLRLTS